jgi:hypothetical protein
MIMISFKYYFRFSYLVFFIVFHFAALAENSSQSVPKVDFSYAFGYPHRLTVALPDSSDKTLVDCSPGQVTLSWTYENLKQYPLANFATPTTRWHAVIKPLVDGNVYATSHWQRKEGWLPVLVSTFKSETVDVVLEIVGGEHGAIIKAQCSNHDSTRAHTAEIDVSVPGNWTGVNPAFIDPELNQFNNDFLIAGWKDRADRVVISTLGGEHYQVLANSTQPSVSLAPGESKTIWVIRPYRVYQSMMPELRTRDWSTEFNSSIQIWRTLIARTSDIQIPDKDIQYAYYAGLSDIFIMREPVADNYLGTLPGTEMYRAPNPIEAAIASIDLVQAGLDVESLDGYRLSLDMQAFDGCWAEPNGWVHDCWMSSGFKSWYVLEYYKITHNKDFLRSIFPRMLASSRWQQRARDRMRKSENAETSLSYGLLPPGMGDAGLKNGDSLYGVFIPHNIWAVYADELTAQAADILGLHDESIEAHAIANTAKKDLIIAMRKGAILEDGHKWISGVQGKTTGSLWGALNAAFPCNILPVNDELISGTLWKMQSHLSPGGLPMHTGWMVNGMWVAITVDNLAETLLGLGDSEGFCRYLYATLNHATPLYSWCEERGPEPGSPDTSGDRQHLWTPVAVVRAIRDSLVLVQDNTLILGKGVDKSWLSRGEVGGDRFKTDFGSVSYHIRLDKASGNIYGKISLDPNRKPGRLRLYLRTQGIGKILSISDKSARIVEQQTALEWDNPASELSFTITKS